MRSRTETLDPRGVGGPAYEPSFGVPGAYLAWFLALLVALFVAVSLGRIVVDAANAAARVEQMRASNAELRAELDTLAAEKRLVTSGVFVQVAGRGRGYGAPEERAFGLLPGSPPPPSLEPSLPSILERGSPLDAWLSALFGS